MHKTLIILTAYTLLLLSQHLYAEIGNHPSPIDPLYHKVEPASDQNQDNSEAKFYPRPMGPSYRPGDEQLNCRQLDEQLARLESDTYSGKPGFYEDPFAGASIFIGAVWAPGALAYMGYSGAAEAYENNRISEAQNRIEALRRMKAKMRCYEY
jgi:hypothetical protein